MQGLFSFLLITSLLASVRMQNWAGIYTIDSTCNTTVCCCFTGQVVFKNQSSNMLGVSCGREGQCGDDTSFSVNISYPSDYTQLFEIQEHAIQVTLASDGQSLAFVDLNNAACSSNATRYNNSIKQQINIMALFAFILVCLMINII